MCQLLLFGGLLKHTVVVDRTMATRRGWIKKIRFAPGRGNMKFFILYIDGFDIWELKEGKVG